MSMTETDGKKAWRAEETRRREIAVREIIMRAGSKLSQNDIKSVTGKLCVSRATAYRMIRTYRTCGAVTDPATRPVGRPRGARVLDATREFLIRDAILNFYFLPSRPKFSDLVNKIKSRCQKEGLPAPNWRTIKARVQDIDTELRARRRERE